MAHLFEGEAAHSGSESSPGDDDVSEEENVEYSDMNADSEEEEEDDNERPQRNRQNKKNKKSRKVVIEDEDEGEDVAEEEGIAEAEDVEDDRLPQEVVVCFGGSRVRMVFAD